MSNMDIELDGADQTASTEVNAANAASDKDTSEEDSLVDYNDYDDEGELITKPAQKAAEKAALKEILNSQQACPPDDSLCRNTSLLFE